MKNSNIEFQRTTLPLGIVGSLFSEEGKALCRMRMRPMRRLFTGLCALLVSLTAAAWAAQPIGPARLEGDVRDSTGKPVAGAQVHIQAKDGSDLQKIVRTDEGGHYECSKLPVTDY